MKSELHPPTGLEWLRPGVGAIVVEAGRREPRSHSPVTIKSIGEKYVTLNAQKVRFSLRNVTRDGRGLFRHGEDPWSGRDELRHPHDPVVREWLDKTRQRLTAHDLRASFLTAINNIQQGRVQEGFHEMDKAVAKAKAELEDL